MVQRLSSGLGLARSVAAAALLQASRLQLIQTAVQHLLEKGQADRVGVWTEFRDHRGFLPNPAAYRGLVSDHNGEFTPAQWSYLSPEPPLPFELLNQRKTVEQELDSSNLLVIGAVTEMRRALWVPVASPGGLRGVVFGAGRKRRGGLSRNVFESVADQLALALELEEERWANRERAKDLELVQRLLSATNLRESLNGVLHDVVGDSAAEGTASTGLAAAFAVLQLTGDSLGQRWCAGDPSRLTLFESEAVGRIWRKALATRRTFAGEMAGGWATGSVDQVVAVPLEVDGEILGVIVAGWAAEKQGPHGVTRLELRAAVAANVLSRSQYVRRARRGEDWKTSVLLASDEAISLLGTDTGIEGMSRGARNLVKMDQQNHGRMVHAGLPLPMLPGPAIAQHFSELFRSADRGRVDAWLQEYRSANPDLPVDADVPSVDAQLLNGVNVRALVILSSQDGGVAIRLNKKAPRDLTAETNHAEAELLAVVEWLEEGVLVFDVEQNVRALNGRFAQMAGLAPDQASRFSTLNQLIGKLSEQVAEPESFAEHWRKLARSDAATREEVQLLLPVPRVLERSARPVLDPTGRRSGWVEIYRDLSSQRIFQSKLLQTEKLAALGQMLTGVAHELNNPLASIVGYADRLVRADGSGEARHIFQEAERASTIARQLLTSARDSLSGRSSVSLNEVIERALELQRFSLAAERVSMEFDLNLALPAISGDAGRLQQVLTNLVGNARQAIDQTGQPGTIRIRTYVSERGLIAVSVADDGPGIPETIRARIFDPFFTTKPPGIGTGLGLAVVLGIVREHGGHVEVSNSPGGGATFILEFPPFSQQKPVRTLRSGEENGVQPATVEPSLLSRLGATELAAWCGARVLIIEDEPTVARLIADVLEDAGLQVDILLNGREALQYAAAKSYALVICDVKMPGMDGRQIYQQLVRATNGFQSGFLFVTGDAAAATTHDFLEQYRLPHLAKPFRMEELIEKVLDALMTMKTV